MYSLQRRRERYFNIYIWKILEKLVPNINNKIKANFTTKHGRKCEIIVKSNTTYSKLKDQISDLGVKLFNLLPKALRNATKIKVDKFKSLLNNYLQTIPGKPHILGKSYQNHRAPSNSLVDIISAVNLDRGRIFHPEESFESLQKVQKKVSNQSISSYTESNANTF